MKFSLILPSRERASLLANFCRTVEENTFDKENIEMLVACDDDDKETIETLKNMKYPWLKYYVRPRGNSISRDYQNWLYPHSKGEYLFVLNDDVELKTKNWDQIALQKIQDYPHKDGIFCGWIADDTKVRIRDKKDAYSCFPLFTRKAVNALGYLMNEYYGGWSADIFIYNVYKEIDRILDMSEILVQHYTHWLGNRERDETNRSMERKSWRKNIIDHKPDSLKLSKLINPVKILL
jgi:hypothetical protein